MSTPHSTPGPWADDAHRYRLESRIATGGMGEVWRATDTTLDREVAVKLLKNEYADDATFRSRFATEARHAAALHHPHIASVYDFGEATSTDGSSVPRPYLVMELVDGRPLSDLLQPGQPLDPDATRYLLAQAADALGAAHAAGIVHRDVKPANLLVTPDRQIKITDFGIARASEGIGLTQTGQVMGTPQYLSPEQARGQQATPASDVYALGVVAFECLAGHRPFQASTPVATALAHLNDPIPALPDDVPADLAAVVRRALSKDPAQRYPNAAAFAAALRDPSGDPSGDPAATQVVAAPGTQVLSTAAAPAVPPTTSTPAPPVEDDDEDTSRRRWLLIALLVALAVAVVVVALLLRGGGDGDDERESPSPSPRPTPRERTTEPTPSPRDTPTATPTTQAPTTIRVSADEYVGRDVREVEADLRRLGLRVTLDELDNPGGAEQGVVESINPTGELEEGSTITVRYWGAAQAETSEPPAQPSNPATEPDDEATTGPGAGTGGGDDTGGASGQSTNGAERGTTR